MDLWWKGNEWLCLLTLSAPPKFTNDSMDDTVTLKSGAAHVLQMPFTAFPKPKVTWTYNDGKLPDAKRMKQETIHGATALTLAKVIKKDEGSYKVTIENKHGNINFTTTVLVLGQ